MTVTTTPDFAAMWGELRAELAGRRESLYEVACDLHDEGKDSAERASGRTAELDDTIEYMDVLAQRRSQEEAATVLARIAGQLFAVDDAIAASAVLAEVSAGHEDAAERLACIAGLEGLSNEEMEALCGAFGVER